MKAIWKFSAVAALALSGGLAQADIALPTAPTGSNLVLFIRDTTPGANPNRVYARGLDLTVDSVLTQAAANGTYAFAQSIPFTIPSPIGPDANLTAFFNAGAAGATYSWTIMASSQNGIGPGSQRYVTTTQREFTANNQLPNNNSLNGSWSQVNTMLGDLNSALPDSGPQNSTQVDGLWGSAGGLYEGATGWFGSAGTSSENDLGATANLFVLVNTADSGTARARLFVATDLQLSMDGTLSSVAAVPLPPALYLLGSAFAGLAGVARRKKAKAA
ncbi:MAG: VPLPA-CTERM sorting domain-containing protein [Pseudomonadota bacterium]